MRTLLCVAWTLGCGLTAIAGPPSHATGDLAKKEHLRASYPRVPAWPYERGPHYGDVARSRQRSAGVFHSAVGRLDLVAGLQELPAELLAEAFPLERDAYFVLLTGSSALEPSRYAALRQGVIDAGGTLVREVPVAGWIVRLHREAHQTLLQRNDLAALTPYHPGFKLDPAIGRTALDDPDDAVSESYKLTVLLFPGEEAPAVHRVVEELGGSLLASSGGWMEIGLHRDRLTELAHHPAIWRIYESLPVHPQGEEVSATTQSGAWFDGAKPFHAAGVDGSGAGIPGTSPRVLMVLDTGVQLDSGDLSDTATSAGIVGPTHRKVLHYAPTNPWGGSGDLLGCEPATHGHVSAVVALGAASTVPASYGAAWPPFKDRLLDGVAPGAKLDAYDAAVGCSGGLAVGNLYTAPSDGSMARAIDDFDASTFNFSWGAGGNTYSAFSAQTDELHHDRPLALAFVSAGNSGPGEQTVLAPANAKNSVAVGATFSGPHPTFDQNDRWNPSSKGPAASQDRTAPLLMAPGSDVASSDATEIYFCGTTDDDQLAPVECSVIEASSGTSEAAPAAAGAALLVRDYFQQGFYPDGTSSDPLNADDQLPEISGAALKSILIASADWVGEGNTPGSNLTFPYRFNNEQGYGRIELAAALPLSNWNRGAKGLIVEDGALAGGIDGLPGLAGTIDAVFAETQVAQFEVVDPREELRVALSWMEASGDFLINDLDLVVQSPDPDGAGPLQPLQYRGNYFTDDNDRDGVLDAGEDCPGIDGGLGAIDASPWSLPICDQSVRDNKHTTEAVFLSPDADADADLDADFNQIVPGTWLVAVISNTGGANAAQPYAVAISGGVTVDGSVYWDRDAAECGQSVSFTVLETDDALDPAAALDATEVAGRVTVRVLEAVGGAVVDVESAPTLVQPDPSTLRFESAALTLVADPSPVHENGILEITTDQILEVVYADESGGAVDPARQKVSTMNAGCSATTPGRIDPLIVRQISPATETLQLQYGPACGASDHTIVYGPLSAVSSYGYTGQQCGLGVSPQALFTPGPGSWFFLIVANDGLGLEGSYGRDWQGNERPQDLDDPNCALTQSLLLPCN